MTTAGTEFVVAFLKNHRFSNQPMLHMITPSELDVEVHIETPTWNSQESLHLTRSLNSSNNLEVKLPVDLRVQTSIVDNKVVLVTSTKPIFLFASDMQLNTGDYFIIYPLKTLGREYIVSGFKSTEVNLDWKSVMGCIAVNADTTVNITVPTGQTLDYNGSIYQQGSTISVFLQMYQIVQVYGFDVTGSFIISDKPIAVFSGHELHINSYQGIVRRTYRKFYRA